MLLFQMQTQHQGTRLPLQLNSARGNSGSLMLLPRTSYKETGWPYRFDGGRIFQELLERPNKKRKLRESDFHKPVVGSSRLKGVESSSKGAAAGLDLR